MPNFLSDILPNLLPNLLDVFLSPFQFQFMQRAFLAGSLVAILAPLLGIFIVTKRYSALTDSLSHVSLAGVATSLLFGFYPTLGATISTVLASILIEKIRQTQKYFSDAILVLFTTGSLGVAIIILGLGHNFGISLESYLFGNISTISSFDIWLIFAIFVLVVVSFLLWFNQFFLISFDEELAQTSGLNTNFLNLVLVILAALIISVSIQTVGVLLISSLMIVPIISALQLKLSFKYTLLSSILIGLLSVWIGLFGSYYWHLASAGTVALINLLIYIVIFGWEKLR